MKKYLKMAMQKKPFIFLDQLIYRVSTHHVTGGGAALTYFLVLSVFPFLIVLLNVLSYTPLGSIDVILDMIKYIPVDIQKIIEGFVNDVVSGSSQGLLSAAAIGGIWTASSGVRAIIRSLNEAYECSDNRSFLKQRGLSILFTVALIIMIVTVFITLVLGKLLGQLVFEFLNITTYFLTIWNYLRFIIPLLFMILTFALLYKYGPNVDGRRSISLKKTLPGALFASLSWILISTLFSFYVSNFGKYSVTYGSLGGVIVLLVWLFISSIIIILGGEINATLESLKERSYKLDPERSFTTNLFKEKEELGKA